MEFEDVVLKLKSGNKHLDQMTKSYFIHVSRLAQPVVGHFSFKDIRHNFLFSLREYSITHSRMIQPYQDPSCRALLRMNSIPVSTLRRFIESVNAILQTYTDSTLSNKATILEQQLNEFVSFNDQEDAIDYKIQVKLSSEYDYGERRHKYLNSVIDALRQAEVNQIENGEYIAINSLLDTFYNMSNYLDTNLFKEKKKYLMKLESDNALKQLIKYIETMHADCIAIDQHEDNEALNMIRFFLFYLIYGKNKVDIYLIHSILGYKYPAAAKLYQTLFCKDHSAGRNDTFLHHTHILHIGLHDIRDENHILLKNILFHMKSSL